MTVQDATNWLNGQIGQHDDFDGQYGTQCVDFFNFYYQYLTGRSPYADGLAVPGAKDIWNCSTPYFDKVANDPNDPNQLPPRGAILFWSGLMPGSGGYGHVAVVDWADANTITVWEEVPGSNVQHITRRWSSPSQHWELGWWVFKGFTEPTPPTPATEPAPAPQPVTPPEAPQPTVTLDPAPSTPPTPETPAVPADAPQPVVIGPEPQPIIKGDDMSVLDQPKSWLARLWGVPFISRAVHTFWQAFLAVFLVGATPIITLVQHSQYSDAKAAAIALVSAAIAAGLSAIKTAIVTISQK